MSDNYRQRAEDRPEAAVRPTQIIERGMWSPVATPEQRAAAEARWLERRMADERRRQVRLRFALGFGAVAGVGLVVAVVLGVVWLWAHIGAVVMVLLAVAGVGLVLAAATGWGGSGRTLSGTFQGKIH